MSLNANSIRVVGVAASAIAVVTLAGCKSTSKSGEDVPVVPVVSYTQVYAADAGSAAKALDSGIVLEAASGANGLTASGSKINYKDRSVSHLSNVEFAIEKNSDGAVDVTLNGEKVNFTLADQGEPWGWSKDQGGNKGLYVYGDPVDATLSPESKHHTMIWQYFMNDAGGDSELTGYAVVGTETRSEVLAGKAKATYAGHGTVRVRDTDDFRNETQIRVEDNSLTMTADFERGVISGEMKNLEARVRSADDRQWSPYTPIGGKIIMEEASISSNGYRGSMSGSLIVPGGEVEEVGAGTTYSGRFYGPEGTETAGVIEVNDEYSVGAGGFRAWQQD